MLLKKQSFFLDRTHTIHYNDWFFDGMRIRVIILKNGFIPGLDPEPDINVDYGEEPVNS